MCKSFRVILIVLFIVSGVWSIPAHAVNCDLFWWDCGDPYTDGHGCWITCHLGGRHFCPDAPRTSQDCTSKCLAGASCNGPCVEKQALNYKLVHCACNECVLVGDYVESHDDHESITPGVVCWVCPGS
jgi:hypothetical protein